MSHNRSADLVHPAVAGGCGCSHEAETCTCAHMPQIDAPSCHSIPADAIDGTLALVVNPEARVYATVEQFAVHGTTIGAPVELDVAVINSGFVTAAIQVDLVGPVDGSIEIEGDRSALTGAPQERRTLRLIPHAEGWIDVTLVFAFPGEPADLGGRDRVHLLVRSANRSHAQV